MREYLVLGSVHTSPKKYENTALFLGLGLPPSELKNALRSFLPKNFRLHDLQFRKINNLQIFQKITCPFFESSSSWMENVHDLFREVRTFSISFRFSWNMYRTRPWRGARTAAISHGQIDATICSRRWYQNIYRDTITFLFSFVGLNSTHCHDALWAWDNSGNQAIAMHRYGVEAWEPISDKCVHVFYSYSHQPSGGLDDTVRDGLHFKTDQLGALAAVCEDNS